MRDAVRARGAPDDTHAHPGPAAADEGAQHRADRRGRAGVLGIILGASGLSQFLAEWGTMSGGPGSILLLGAGGFCLVGALAAANAGWMRAGAAYTAGETMPVVKDAAAYLTDGQGLRALGRTGAAATGAFCRQCGVQTSAGDRFCSGCGTSLT